VDGGLEKEVTEHRAVRATEGKSNSSSKHPVREGRGEEEGMSNESDQA
jgi:hypothetical protein